LSTLLLLAFFKKENFLI